MPSATGIVAIGQRTHKEFCFIVKPSPGSRKSDIVPTQQIPEIRNMFFVSNSHIAVKFHSGKFVHFDSNGSIVHQTDDFTTELDSDAYHIGESELVDGKKYLTMMIEDCQIAIRYN